MCENHQRRCWSFCTLPSDTSTSPRPSTKLESWPVTHTKVDQAEDQCGVALDFVDREHAPVHVCLEVNWKDTVSNRLAPLTEKLFALVVIWLVAHKAGRVRNSFKREPRMTCGTPQKRPTRRFNWSWYGNCISEKASLSMPNTFLNSSSDK